MPERKLFKILSIDGGGIRGIIPAILLTELERRTGKPIAQLFDLITGTSTGGILTLALTRPNAQGQPQFAAADLIGLYEKEGPEIFPESLFRKVITLGHTLREKYPATGVETVLQKYFGESRLKEALTSVLVTSYDIEQRSPWLFRSERAKLNPFYDFPMWQVARSTSAAPTYFEPEQIQMPDINDQWALVDGGTFANNPSMCAYAEALHLHPEYDVLMVSLGTGEYTTPLEYDKAKKWGLIGWARSVIDVVFDGVSKTTDYQLQQLLPASEGHRRYYRFQLTLEKGTDQMDDTAPENLESLKRQANAMLLKHDLDLEELCKRLLSDPPLVSNSQSKTASMRRDEESFRN